MNTSGMMLVPQGVLVIWEWDWLGDGSSDSSSEDEAHGHYNPYMKSDSETADSDTELTPFTLPSQTHVVTFKCMGTTYSLHAQETLKEASRLLRQGVNVQVKMVPEPKNQFDAKAIAFHCQIDDEWHRIGYVVRETLEHVHKAISQNRIIYVKFSWAKYLVIWMQSGPGYYAGINIAINGEWPSVVVRHASTH